MESFKAIFTEQLIFYFQGRIQNYNESQSQRNIKKIQKKHELHDNKVYIYFQNIYIQYLNIMSINQFSSVNDRQKEKILNMKKRIESLQFNSTLFKNISVQNDSKMEKSDQFQNFNLQGYSAISNTDFYQPPEAQSNLGSRIDQILSKNRNKNRGKVPTALYQQILNDKDIRDLSSNLSKSDISENISQKNLNIHTKNLYKLKTIEEQIGNTLTINKETIEMEKNKKEKASESKNSTSRSRPPLSSSSTIQRQKQKIREAMGQIHKIKKEDQIQIQDKESVVFDLSDNESQLEQKQNKNEQSKIKQQEKLQRQRQLKEEEMKRKIKKQNLQKQRNQLEEQLSKIQYELASLETEQENEY